MVKKMTTAQKLILQLIRYEINNKPVDASLISQVNEDVLDEIFRCSSEHDVGYIVGSALHKLGLLSGELQTAFFNEQLASMYRYERIKYESECIAKLFEEEDIKFVFLKGTVIRNLYPKPEMRMSCDVDILVLPEDIDRAGEVLKTKLSFAFDSRCGHEINWLSPSGLKVELHFTLLEREYKIKELLDKVWEYAKPIQDGSSQHILSNEFFVYYHISHISKHFLNGGCGIRQFLDLWFIKNNLSYDNKVLDDMLETSKLDKFADVVFDVANVWFSDNYEAKLPDGTEEYILNGAFGSTENHVIMEKNKNNKSRLHMVLKLVFASGETIKNLYPQAMKHPVLIPYYSVARWCRIIFKDRMKKQAGMIKAINAISDDKQNNIKSFMKEIGLGEQYDEQQPRN